ncbi:MAG: hypothetical protein AABW57_02390 [Nanoarchaeota archaeon]
MAWYENVDPTIKNYLEALIKSTLSNKEIYELSKNKAAAQLWVALATIYKQTFNLDQRIKYIERLLQDLVKEIKELKEQQELIEMKLNIPLKFKKK